MTPAEQLYAYAQFDEAQRAVDTLGRLSLISMDERIRLMRKFMDDRPAFRDAVQARIDAATRELTKEVPQ